MAEHEGEIIATALVYDGARLNELRKPVAEQIKLVFGKISTLGMKPSG